MTHTLRRIGVKLYTRALSAGNELISADERCVAAADLSKSECSISSRMSRQRFSSGKCRAVICTAIVDSRIHTGYHERTNQWIGNSIYE